MTAMSSRPKGSALDRATVLAALERLSARLAERGIEGEICLFGGTAMMLAFAARLSTRDVDAFFEPSAAIREEVAAVDKALGL